AVEADVGRGVARDDGARRVLGQRGAQRRQLVLDVPAVGRADLLLVVIAARRIRQGAAAVVLRLGNLIVRVKRFAGFLHGRSTLRTNRERVKWLALGDPFVADRANVVAIEAIIDSAIDM